MSLSGSKKTNVNPLYFENAYEQLGIEMVPFRDGMTILPPPQINCQKIVNELKSKPGNLI